MEIVPAQPPAQGPAEFFVGEVWFDSIGRGEGRLSARVSTIRFAAGARTKWHSHALGQTLHVTEGEGLVQTRSGEVVRVRAGETVFAPPDEWHWHGAAPEQSMTHISVIEGSVDDGRPETQWGEHVRDDEYLGTA